MHYCWLLGVIGLLGSLASVLNCGFGLQQQMAGSLIKPLVIGAQGRAATATCVISHGLGDTAHGWADGAMMLSARLPHVRFILPTAPVIPITRFNGQEGTAWFDLIGTQERRDEPCEGLEQSMDTLKGIIEEEKAAGIPSSRLALLGFSQGAALSLYTGLVGLEEPPAAVVAMSGYLPRTATAHIRNSGVKVLQWHGDADTMVDLRFGEEARDKMKDAGVGVDFRLVLGLPHSVTQEELESTAQWLGKILD